MRYIVIILLLFAGMTARGQSTGNQSPAATGEDYNQWSNAINGLTSNDLRTSGTPDGMQYQDYYNFNFYSLIPENAIITGIIVSIEGNGSFAGSDAIIEVELSWDGGMSYTSQNKQQTFTGTTDVVKTYGSASDLWGHEWIRNDLSNDNFRLRIEAIYAGYDYCRVDHIQVNVYYAIPVADTRNRIIWFLYNSFAGSDTIPGQDELTELHFGYDSTYTLAVTQKFAIPENLSAGDYVGYWKPTYTWMSGNTITYDIEENYGNGIAPAGDAFAINPTTGLIYVNDPMEIDGRIVQQDTLINIIIRTTDPILGYELDTAKIWVKENSYCKFYDFTTSGTGTRASPYNDMDAVAFAAGYGYFLKRGTQAQTGETTVLTALIGTSANPTIIGAYGQGNKPKFVGAGTEQTECFFLGNSTDANNGRCEHLYFYDIHIRHYGVSAWKARTYTNNVGWYNCQVNNNGLFDNAYPAISINDQTYADSIIQRPFEFINHISDTCPASHIKCGNGPLRISNIYCHGGTDGIRFALGNNGYIKHAYINRTLTGASDDAGIQIRGDNILIEDVRILTGNGAGIDITSTITSGFLGMPDNVKIKNAYINGVGGYGIGIWKPDASSMTGVNDTIEDCIIANAGTRGIRINSGGGHVIQRNIIYGSGDYGIYAYTVYQMNNLKIYYNIIYNSISTDLYLQNGSGHTVYNNVIDGSAIFTSSTTTVRNNIFNTISGGNTVSNNLLIPDISTANYFVDYAAHNYRLKSTATNAINAGYDVGIDYDIAGNAVSSPPEIGAYEY